MLHDLFADPAALRRGADREHAEVAMTVLVGDVAAGQQPPALFGQQDHAARPLDVGEQARGVHPLAVEEIGFGGPAHARGVAAVGRGDQFDQGRNVVRGGAAEGEGIHRRIVAMPDFLVDAGLARMP